MSDFVIPHIPLSYQTQLANEFKLLLQQQGSKLEQYVTPQVVVGKEADIDFLETGNPKFVDTQNPMSEEYTQVRYGKRKLRPKAFYQKAFMNFYDHLAQGTMPDVNALATDLVMKTSAFLDSIIIDGISGGAVVSNADRTTRIVNLEAENTIAWNSNRTFPAGAAIAVGGNNVAGANPPAGSDIPLYTWRGLNSAKLSEAVTKLMSNHSTPDIFCVCRPTDLEALKGDPRVQSALTNWAGATPSMGVMRSYGGVLDFVTTDYIKDHAPNRHYVYVFSRAMVYLGCNLPLQTVWGVEKSIHPTLLAHGSYDCTRYQEEGVVRIEINTCQNPAAIA